MQDPWGWGWGRGFSPPRRADQFAQPPLTHLQRPQLISMWKQLAQSLFLPAHPSLAPRPMSDDGGLHCSHHMPAHQPTHLCCCGGSLGGGHPPSAPGHSCPEVGPEAGAVVPGGLAASEVPLVSCEERMGRSLRGAQASQPPAAPSARPYLSKASPHHHCLTVRLWAALSTSLGLPSPCD